MAKTQVVTTPLAAGFADPVREQQRAFRAAMDALARPGRIVPHQSRLQGAPVAANAADLALTLLDFEVRYFLGDSLAGAEEFMTFHTGSVRTRVAGEAEFAFLDLRKDALDLAAFMQGIPEYPDRSTTIIALCATLDAASPLVLRGPGIAGAVPLAIDPLPADFVAQWSANAARAPLGVDMVFVSDAGFVGLPRSARIIGEAR